MKEHVSVRGSALEYGFHRSSPTAKKREISIALANFTWNPRWGVRLDRFPLELSDPLDLQIRDWQCLLVGLEKFL